jgi:3'-5' exoribonuclease 1
LEKDCIKCALKTNWLDQHISIKHQYSEITNTKLMGMKAALTKEGIVLDGTHHRGIDDARNISKIFIKRIKEWKHIKI